MRVCVNKNQRALCARKDKVEYQMFTIVDNPSYFAVAQGLQRRILPLVDRQRMAKNKTETCSMGRTRKNERSGKCLTRTLSANIEEARLLVMGQPRPSDVAPSVKHRRHTSSGHKVGKFYLKKKLYNFVYYLDVL